MVGLVEQSHRDEITDGQVQRSLRQTDASAELGETHRVVLGGEGVQDRDDRADDGNRVEAS